MKTPVPLSFGRWLPLVAGLVIPGSAAATASVNDHPNIIYILTDDLGYGDLKVYNPESKISTPRIDGLAAEGMRFTQAHTASAVCTPTRYSVLTGQYAWRTSLQEGVTWSYGRVFMEEGRETVATLLRDHGYTTAVIGKWHLGLNWALKDGPEHSLGNIGKDIAVGGAIRDIDRRHIDFSRPVTRGPRDFGFDYSFILPASLDIPPYCYLEDHEVLEPPTDWTEGNDLDRGKAMAFWRPGPMAPGFDFGDVLPRFIRESIAYMEEQAATQSPFFLYLPLPAPHTPWLPTDDFRGASDAGLYGDFVQMVDTHVGEILDAVERLGIAENTVVVFTSDNGPYWRQAFIDRHDHRAAGPFRGMKGDIWDAGHRVPFIVRWPGQVAPGSVSHALTSTTHLLATCADALGVPKPSGAVDSHSILPVLLWGAQSVPGQPGIMMHSASGHFAYRSGDWKFIERRGSGGFTSPVSFEVLDGEPPAQLYNLAVDPAESRNLYFREPEKVEALTQAMQAIRNQ